MRRRGREVKDGRGEKVVEDMISESLAMVSHSQKGNTTPVRSFLILKPQRRNQGKNEQEPPKIGKKEKSIPSKPSIRCFYTDRGPKLDT